MRTENKNGPRAIGNSPMAVMGMATWNQSGASIANLKTMGCIRSVTYVSTGRYSVTFWPHPRFFILFGSAGSDGVNATFIAPIGTGTQIKPGWNTNVQLVGISPYTGRNPQVVHLTVVGIPAN